MGRPSTRAGPSCPTDVAGTCPVAAGSQAAGVLQVKILSAMAERSRRAYDAAILEFHEKVHEHPPRLQLIGYYGGTSSDGIARRGPFNWRSYQGNLYLVMNRGLLNDRNDTM